MYAPKCTICRNPTSGVAGREKDPTFSCARLKYESDDESEPEREYALVTGSCAGCFRKVLLLAPIQATIVRTLAVITQDASAASSTSTTAAPAVRGRFFLQMMMMVLFPVRRGHRQRHQIAIVVPVLVGEQFARLLLLPAQTLVHQQRLLRITILLEEEERKNKTKQMVKKLSSRRKIYHPTSVMFRWILTASSAAAVLLFVARVRNRTEIPFATIALLELPFAGPRFPLVVVMICSNVPRLSRRFSFSRFRSAIIAAAAASSRSRSFSRARSSRLISFDDFPSRAIETDDSRTDDEEPPTSRDADEDEEDAPLMATFASCCASITTVAPAPDEAATADDDDVAEADEAVALNGFSVTWWKSDSSII
uniref:Uncharacterized protein n=1 Tax=Anopheles atroparvus TaxID=41427 RepID=A0A182JCR8_ANOAO